MLDSKLDTFLVLCETRNYTRAASVLNITQPAVTQHIKYLENHYSTKLFYYDEKRGPLPKPSRLIPSKLPSALKHLLRSLIRSRSVLL